MITELTIDGKLIIDVGDLLKSCSTAGKQELINHLTCDDEVLRKVSEQLTEGYWDDGGGFWHGSSTILDQARINIASRANEIYEKEIKRLQKEANDWRERYNKLWEDVNPRNNY